MFNKKIANVVFYQFFDQEDSEKKACVFFSDGTVREVSFEDGIDACEILVKEHDIRSKDVFREMINKNLVHVLPGDVFLKRFRDYFPVKYDVEVEDTSKNVEKVHKIPVVEEASKSDSSDSKKQSDDSNKVVFNNDKKKVLDPIEDEDEDEDDYDDYEDYDDSIEDEDIIEEEEKPKGFFARCWEKIKKNSFVRRLIVCVTAFAIGLGLYSCGSRKTLDGQMNRSNISSTISNTDEDKNVIVLGSNNRYNNLNFKELQNVTNNNFQKKAMKNVHDAMDKFNHEFATHYLEDGKNVLACLKFDEVVSLQMAYNNYSKDDIKAYFNGAEIKSSDLSRAYKDASLQLMGAYVIENSKYPVDMSMLIDTQEGKDFYNKYHKAFLEAKEAKGDDKLSKVTEFYRMVRSDFPVSKEKRTEGISHSENYTSIDSYKLSVTPMIAAAEMLWQNLKTDVTLKDGEIDFFNDLGLCNYADETFEKIETITLVSAEDDSNPLYSQYRNSIIKEFKDLGYYYVDDKQRELSSLKSFQDAVNWHFEEKTTSSQKKSSGKSSSKSSKSSKSTETSSYTESNTTYHEEVTTQAKVMPSSVQAEVDKPIFEENNEAKRRAEREAEEYRRELQEEADEEAREIRREVREDAEDLQDRIDDANEIIRKNHEDDNPNNDQKINEDDFGDHEVEFFSEYSDSQGNLDSSVQNITTDSTGYKANEKLPDPNVSGKKFDEKAPDYFEDVTNSNTSTQTVVEEEVSVSSTNDDSQDAWVEVVPVSDDYYYEGAWVERSDGTVISEVEVSSDSSDSQEAYTVYTSGEDNTDSVVTSATNEEIVDSYVEAMASSDEEDPNLLLKYGSDLEEEDFDAEYQYVR